MPNRFKNIIKVNREEEKRFYRIMHDLETKRESIIEDASTPEWHSTLISLGKRAKPLIDNNILKQPLVWNTRTRSNIDMRLIHLPDDIVIEEIEGNKQSFFHFKRRKII